ncbi:MAG: peroxiredoxin [Flavobacteriaceae bacterium]|nr:peroxiredoxin [Flavobacteriaceae bacterium]
MNKNKSIKIGDKLPSFILKNQYGETFNSDDFIGKTAMVVYFYPKDDTPGCTKEACSFRDSYEEFLEKNVKVIGISSDNIKSHKNFSDKYNLPFTLLADTKKEVRKLFGVPSSVLGLIPGRVTYVVNNKGIIIYIYNSMTNAETHIQEALKALQ